MQRKQKIGIIVTFLFMVSLTCASVAGASDIRFLGQVKEAMRDIRRADNLHYIYTNAVSYKNSSETSRVEVWADLLTDSWRADYSIIDEDGEWLFLRKYCDGKSIYYDNQWDEDWDISEENEELDVPNIEELTILTYNTKDILEESIEYEDGYSVIFHMFTPEYTAELLQENREELEQMWYHSISDGDNPANENLLLKQYQQTKVSDAAVTYWLDKEGVLCKKEMTITLLRPRLEFAADGTKTLGEQEEISIITGVEVLEYNADSMVQNISAQ